METLNLIQDHAEFYTTEDGRYTVQTEASVMDCDAPHPVRLGKDAYAEWRAMSEWDKGLVRPHERRMAFLSGKRAYLCPGDQDHDHKYWTIWDNTVDDYYGNGGVLDLETFGAAVTMLEHDLKVKIVVKRPRRIAVPLRHDAEMHVTVAEDTPPETMAALEAVGNAAADLMYKAELEDELRALTENIERAASLLATEDGPWIDHELIATNNRRKLVVEKLLREMETP